MSGEDEKVSSGADGRDEDKLRSLDNIPIYSLDPFYGPRLSRIDAIFFQLKLDSEGCRQQV